MELGEDGTMGQGGQELRFDGQVAIVTGAGRGVGRAHALALAQRGAKLVVNDLGNALAGDGGHDRGLAQTVADEIVAAGGEAIANTADVADVDAAASIAADAIERFGRIDVLVNNAGNLDPGGLPDLDVEHVARHLDIHVLGSFNVTKAVWPQLVKRGYGRVVMTSSIGLFGGQHMISYSTAKGGVLSLGRSLAPGGAEHGIKVNVLAPAAETRMVTDPEFRAKCNLPPVDPNAAPDPSRAPEHVTPMLLVLAHESCPVNGELLTAGLGRFGRIFLAETPGIVVPDISAEGVLERWDEIVDASSYVVPATTADSVAFREALLTGTAHA